MENSANDSCKDGRDSGFVNWVFGKILEAAAAAKFLRHVAAVFLDLPIFFCGSGEPSRGLGQQPLRHTWEASFRQGDCIFFFLFVLSPQQY